MTTQKTRHSTDLDSKYKIYVLQPCVNRSIKSQKEQRLHTPVNSNERRKYGSDKSYGDAEKDFSIPRISIEH